MTCAIIKHEITGEEFLIPGCSGVALHYHLDMSDRELIKEYCYCERNRKDKYESKTRDEVFSIISEFKNKIYTLENELAKLKDTLGGLETEVFMLNTVEVVSFPASDEPEIEE